MTEGHNEVPGEEGARGGDNSSQDSTHSPLTLPPETSIQPNVPIKRGQLFGPFPDPLQWLALKYTESATAKREPHFPTDLFKAIEIAKNSEEQNLEIVLRGGNFFFRCLCDIRSPGTTKLMAWFCSELNSKLPLPSSSILNGTKRYYCGLCNQVFLFPNSVVVHILFSCSKRHNIIPTTETMATPKIDPSVPSNSQILPMSTINHQMPSSKTQINQTLAKTSSAAPKKRGFDIASLVKNDDEDERY